jgi:hypothetical protein
MWQIDNRTPFAAERGWVRDRDGTELWLVAVKATFDIGPDGQLAVSKEQPPVLRLPEHYGEVGRSSVKYDADLVLTKPTTDVIVVGHAHAAAGTSVTQLDVGFRVGPVKKVLRVFGDRTWGRFGPTSPRAFERMPIVYERAFGGTDPASSLTRPNWDWRNPVGTGFTTSARAAVGLSLPNIEDPRDLIADWSDHPVPAGFGVIASHWQPRVGHAGTYDDHWRATRQPLLAEDLDDRYFQSAPQDQQAPSLLRGGEPVVCQGLSPSGLLRFFLPKLYLGFETRFYDGSREVHKTRRLHTVIVEPDYPRVSMVWHSALPCHHKVQKLERTFITQKTPLTEREAAEYDAALAIA